MDEDLLSANEKGNQLHQQVMKKVVIPVNGRSSIASSLSSVRDQSSEYDTPGTSVVVTPAESLMKEERSFKRPTRDSSNIPSHQHKESSIKGKRKRLEVDEFMEADALLAQKLQEQEYGKDQEVAPRRRRARNGPIEDSEESLLSDLIREHSPNSNDLSELNIVIAGRPNRRLKNHLLSEAALADVESDRPQEESFDEDQISESPLPRHKRVKPNHRTSLPSRAARNSANQSIIDRTSRGILDSEDSELSDHSDDASLFGFDTGSDAFEDSADADEGADDDVGAADSTTTATAATNISAIPATSRRGRGRGTGRRGAPSAHANNPTRGRRSWQRRVEDRVSSEIPLIPHTGLRDGLGYKRAAKARESAP